MVKSIITLASVLLFSGCYTQFSTLDRMEANQSIGSDSSKASDSTVSKVRQTISVNNNQTCYWTRDIWGQPELRCYDSYYGQDWYRYNYYPWWNRSSAYYYGDYNSYGYNQQCPAFYYYDYSCGMCRYYTGYSGYQNRSWWWNSPGSYYNSGSSSSSATASPRARDSRSFGVPGSSEIARNGGRQLQKESTMPLGGTTSSNTAGSATAAEPRSRNRSEGVPTTGEMRSQPRVELPSGQDLAKQQSSPPPQPAQLPQSIQQSPPPSPPPSNSGQNSSSGNDNGGRGRGNARGW